MERLQVLAQWPGLVVQVGVNPQIVCFENDYDTLATTPKKKDIKINLSDWDCGHLLSFAKKLRNIATILG